jgi:hypothetical protein
MPELTTITSPYVHSRVDSNTFTMGNRTPDGETARVDLNPMPESTLSPRARICRSCKETRYRFSAWRASTKPYLSYWPARLHRLAKSIPRNRCLGSINVYKYGLSLRSLGIDSPPPPPTKLTWRPSTTTLFEVQRPK